MEDFIFNEKLLNKYHNENERRIAREEGMAAQKAEDEVLLKEKDAVISRILAENEKLKAQLAQNK